MAFVCPSASAAPTCQQSAHCKQSRRDFLRIAFAGTVTAFIPNRSKAQESALPPGAAQFSRLIAAQKQWSGVRAVFEKGDLTDSDWGNLRGYLRTVYSVSGDMEFIAKPWEKNLKDQGLDIATRFRSTVKGMDKPAMKKDVAEFSRMQAEVEGIFTEFFDVFTKATVSDIPDEI